MLVSCTSDESTCAPTANPNLKGTTITAFASNLREQVFKSVNVTQCDDDSEIFESVMENVGINTHALQQTTVLVDILLLCM